VGRVEAQERKYSYIFFESTPDFYIHVISTSPYIFKFVCIKMCFTSFSICLKTKICEIEIGKSKNLCNFFLLSVFY